MSTSSSIRSSTRARRQPPRRPRRSEDAHIVRVLSLLVAMARSRRGVNLVQFAEERGYGRSAVYRDRDTLRAAGLRLECSGGRYTLPDGWLPPTATGASRDELLALFVARRLAPGLRGTRVARLLDSLGAKLAAPGAQTSLTFPDEASLSVPTLAAIDYAPHNLTIDTLHAALHERRAVRIRYRRPGGDETERVIEPGFLHWDGRLETLYVPSWCRLRGAVRVFAVHRIYDAQLTDDAFAARPETRRSALEKAFQIWMSARVEPVAVHFAAQVAGELRERRRHASQRIVEVGDGSVILHLDVAEPDELTRWIMGYGPDARVLAPERLASRVLALHEAAAAPASVTKAINGALASARAAAAGGNPGTRQVRRAGERRP